MTTKLHISLDVSQFDESVKFYSTLFDTTPTKVKPGYAKFDLDNPAVVLTLGQDKSGKKITGPNHMGVRVDSLEKVVAAKDRLEAAGYKTADEMGVTCCYAVQDKIWATDPSGYRWEVYIFKGDAEQYVSSQRTPAAEAAGVDCLCCDTCSDTPANEAGVKEEATCACSK